MSIAYFSQQCSDTLECRGYCPSLFIIGKIKRQFNPVLIIRIIFFLEHVGEIIYIASILLI